MFQQPPTKLEGQAIPDHIQIARNLAKAINDISPAGLRREAFDTMQNIVIETMQQEHKFAESRAYQAKQELDELEFALSGLV